MRPLNNLIFILLVGLCSYGQRVQSDTFLSRVKSIAIKPDDKDFLQAVKGAENYLNSLLGDTFYATHIKINFKQTKKDEFDVYVSKSGDTQFLESHVYYDINYYVTDKKDTLSYFDLLVDSLGKRIEYDKNFDFSSPTKLLLMFRNLFPNKYKIDFATAVVIGRQHGFQRKPFLNCNSINKVRGIYWSFSKRFADGKRKFMDINVETGSLKEFYMLNLE